VAPRLVEVAVLPVADVDRLRARLPDRLLAVGVDLHRAPRDAAVFPRA